MGFVPFGVQASKSDVHDEDGFNVGATEEQQARASRGTLSQQIILQRRVFLYN